MENCLFCRIAGKQIEAAVIYEDDHAVAFLDVNPRTTGHAMVIPKVHAPNILELPDAEVGPLFAAVKRVAGMLAKALAPDGITIGMNQGRASGQEVDHLHVHLLPRWHGDGGSSIQSVVNRRPAESIEEVRRKILA
ncbi:MAG TPA: HIT family protein [Candidatus Paceibacterota bacterium]|nr:HIT family protein [Candidatus Paceibacterota bacterium]